LTSHPSPKYPIFRFVREKKLNKDMSSDAHFSNTMGYIDKTGNQKRESFELAGR
jgi:hypothetical protein